MGVYGGSLLAGFALYGCFAAPLSGKQVWLDRFLIGRDYQGKGYGRAAVSGTLQKLCGE